MFQLTDAGYAEPLQALEKVLVRSEIPEGNIQPPASSYKYRGKSSQVAYPVSSYIVDLQHPRGGIHRTIILSVDMSLRLFFVQ